MKKNDVCSFMIYMANKWCRIYKTHGAMGAIPYFFLELNNEYQDLLVKRATECYDRRTEINKQLWIA